jgi:hypothetical protein
MELLFKLHVEKPPEGLYLATSDEMPCLIARGRTIYETLEIARDVAKKIVETGKERNEPLVMSEAVRHPLVQASRPENRR